MSNICVECLEKVTTVKHIDQCIHTQPCAIECVFLWSKATGISDICKHNVRCTVNVNGFNISESSIVFIFVTFLCISIRKYRQVALFP